MSADHGKPRFEPPPWEREAFERFQAEHPPAKADLELEAALQRVREPKVAQEPAEPAAADAQPPATAEVQSEKPAVSEAKMNSMLVQLRMEEKPAAPPSPALINTVCAVLLLVGAVIVVQSARLFADARGADASLNMLSALMSFMLFLTGLGFGGGAVLLFRKYHS